MSLDLYGSREGSNKDFEYLGSISNFAWERFCNAVIQANLPTLRRFTDAGEINSRGVTIELRKLANDQTLQKSDSSGVPEILKMMSEHRGLLVTDGLDADPEPE